MFRFKIIFLGFYLSVSMRVNLSMAVTCMVNSTAYPDVVVEKSSGDEKRSSTGTCGAINYNSTESVALSGYNVRLHLPQFFSFALVKVNITAKR